MMPAIVQLEGITIEWAENPLATIVRIDACGRWRLRAGIATDAIFQAQAVLDLIKREGVEKWVDTFDYADVAVEAKLDREMKWCEEGLLGIHCGDCTCVPESCIKCHAESFLRIDTTEGLGKHEGNAMQSAFADNRSLFEAITWLEEAPITATWAGWEQYAPRWRVERDSAAAWLRAYQIQHFSMAGR